MNKLRLFDFSEYEDGMMAHAQMIGEDEIPLNIFIDNYSEVSNLHDCDIDIDICGVGCEFEAYETEEEYYKQDPMLSSIALIPIGTFSVNSDDTDFKQSPHILFGGIVREVEFNAEAGDNEPNYCLTVDTLGITLTLFVSYQSEIKKGYIVHGVAWLYGDIAKEQRG